MEADETSQHKMFLDMSPEALAEARQYYQTKYKGLVSFSPESDSFIQALRDLQYMREAYENGILAINKVRCGSPDSGNVSDSGLTTLDDGLEFLFNGLHKHIDLQIYLFESYEKSKSSYSASVEQKQKDRPVLVGPAELKTVNHLTGIEVVPSQPPDTSSVVVKLESDTTETKVDISKDDTDDIAHVVDKTDKEQNKENEISTKWNDDKTEVKEKVRLIGLEKQKSAKRVKKKKRRQCEICLEFFPSIRNLNSHMKTHTGVDLHPCDQCPRVFATSHVLKVHYRVHTGEKPYKCEHCPKEFSQKGILDRHIRIHTGEKPYKCDQCLRAFSTSHSLKNHVQTHTGEKPFTCDECGIKFAHSKTLVNHKKMKHSEVPVKVAKPYKCDVCPKAFTAQVYLTIHMRSHTGERPFECGLCSKAFTNKGTLNHHTKLHKGEKNFKCETCNKAWVRKSRLIAHMRTHTGEKPFKCDVCQKDFSRNDLLKKHLKSHRLQATDDGGNSAAALAAAAASSRQHEQLFRGGQMVAAGGHRMDVEQQHRMEELYRAGVAQHHRLGGSAGDMNRMMDERMQENPLFRGNRGVLDNRLPEAQLFRNNRHNHMEGNLSVLSSEANFLCKNEYDH